MSALQQQQRVQVQQSGNNNHISVHNALSGYFQDKADPPFRKGLSGDWFPELDS